MKHDDQSRAHYFIRLANQQVIASINVQPGNRNYVLFPNDQGNAMVPMNSPAELMSVLQQRNLAEVRNYLVREYIANKPHHIDEVREMLKKQLAEQTGPGRKSTTEIVKVESDWKIYWGSSKELLKDVKELGEDHFECIILKLCKTKKQLTYYEMHYQCKAECLMYPSTTYNDNILGKFFGKDLVD